MVLVLMHSVTLRGVFPGLVDDPLITVQHKRRLSLSCD